MEEPKSPRRRSSKVSRPLALYIERNGEMIDWFWLNFKLAEQADDEFKFLTSLLAQGEFDIDKREKLIKDSKEGAGYFLRAKKYIPLINEILLCRAADGFLAYISNFLFLMHKSRHELLRTDEKISYYDVITTENRDDLIHLLIEKRISDLEYLGFYKLNEEMWKRFKIKIVERKEDVRRANQIIEARNLYVHAGGIVNRRSVIRCPDFSKIIGKKVQLENSAIENIFFLNRIAFEFDRRARTKFRGIPTIPVHYQLKDFERRERYEETAVPETSATS
jgi:hypothetical protein